MTGTFIMTHSDYGDVTHHSDMEFLLEIYIVNCSHDSFEMKLSFYTKFLPSMQTFLII